MDVEIKNIEIQIVIDVEIERYKSEVVLDTFCCHFDQPGPRNPVIIYLYLSIFLLFFGCLQQE